MLGGYYSQRSGGHCHPPPKGKRACLAMSLYLICVFFIFYIVFYIVLACIIYTFGGFWIDIPGLVFVE